MWSSYDRGIEENFLNQKKGIYQKPAANIILNIYKLNLFPIKSEKGKYTNICCHHFYSTLHL